MKLEYQELPFAARQEFLRRFEDSVIRALARKCGITDGRLSIKSLVTALAKSERITMRADVSIGIRSINDDRRIEAQSETLKPPVDVDKSADYQEESLSWLEHRHVFELAESTVPVDAENRAIPIGKLSPEIGR